MVDIQFGTAEIRRGKEEELECGPIPNVMAALGQQPPKMFISS